MSRKYLFSIGLVGFLLMGVAMVFAAPLADTDDRFVVDQPRASTTLSGESTVRFRLYDDDRDNPPYEVALYSSNCIDKFGVIEANNYAIKSADNVYSFTWNTDGPIKTMSSVPDGNYCFKVCTTLVTNEGTNYAVCDARPVTLTEEVNHAPQITSTPPNSNMLVGQKYGYDVNATDPDSDTLIFSLVNAPDFLQINSSSGEISTKGALSETGTFSFIVKVVDGKDGEDTQELTINVVEEPKPVILKVEVTNPTSNTIFSEDNNTIKWELENAEDIESIKVFYSTDAEDWILIEELDPETREYNWDVSELDDGDYYLKIEVIDGAGKKYEIISEKFSISNEKELEETISIIDVYPGDEVEIESLKEIRATIVVSEGLELDKGSLKVSLDDDDITDLCVITEESLNCNLESMDIAEGKHNLVIEISSKEGKSASSDTFFNVSEEVPEEDSGSEEISGLSTIAIVGLICLIVGLLILIPWILYTLWRRNQTKEPFEQIDTVGMPPEDNPLQPEQDLTNNYYTAEYTPPAESDTVNNGSDSYDEDDYSIGEGVIGVSESSPEPEVDTNPVVTIDEPSKEDIQKQVEEMKSPTQVQSLPQDIATQSPLPSESDDTVIETQSEPLQQDQPKQDTIPMSDQPSLSDSVSSETPMSPMIDSEKEENVEMTPQSAELPKSTDAQGTGIDEAQESTQEATFLDAGSDDQFTEDDIPDWLKGDSSSSNPVGPGGTNVDIQTEQEKKEDMSGAEPYSDYGLATKDNGDS